MCYLSSFLARAQYADLPWVKWKDGTILPSTFTPTQTGGTSSTNHVRLRIGVSRSSGCFWVWACPSCYLLCSLPSSILPDLFSQTPLPRYWRWSAFFKVIFFLLASLHWVANTLCAISHREISVEKLLQSRLSPLRYIDPSVRDQFAQTMRELELGVLEPYIARSNCEFVCCW